MYSDRLILRLFVFPSAWLSVGLAVYPSVYRHPLVRWSVFPFVRYVHWCVYVCTLAAFRASDFGFFL